MAKSVIRYFRELKRFKQQQLADFIGVSVDSIRRWENGTREPRESDIKKLCAVLGCSEAQLLNGPVDAKYKVTLKFVSNLREENNEMLMKGNGAVTVTDDGMVLASHLGKLETAEDKSSILEAIGQKLDEALGVIQHRAAQDKERKQKEE